MNKQLILLEIQLKIKENKSLCYSCIALIDTMMRREYLDFVKNPYVFIDKGMHSTCLKNFGWMILMKFCMPMNTVLRKE